MHPTLFIIAKIWKQPKCSSIDGWIEKMYICNGILDLKKNKILPFATTQMDPQGFMLSEISQTEKDKYCMI